MSSNRFRHYHLFLQYLLLISVSGVIGQDDQCAFMTIQLQAANEIPSDCQAEFKLPGRAISGGNVNWTYLCSDQLMKECTPVLKYTFLLEYSETENQLISDLLHHLTVIGAQHVCQINQTTIQALMNSGGSSCLSSSCKALDYCSYVSILKYVSGNDPESLCRALDYSIDCAIEAISHCNLTQLSDMWINYYRKTITNTICERFTKYADYGSHATHNTYANYSFIIFILGFLLLANTSVIV